MEENKKRLGVKAMAYFDSLCTKQLSGNVSVAFGGRIKIESWDTKKKN